MTSTVLITGCSSGFGKTTAERFLQNGWNVIATMRSPSAGLFEPGDRLMLTALDVTKPESVSGAIAAGVARFKGIDALVNNAGIGLFGAHEATPDTVIREVFETNTFGVMSVCQAVTPHMRERRTGTIVNVTSSVAIAPMPLVAAYAASKCATEGFSEALAHELRPLGIRVRLVQPGLAPSTSFAANSGRSTVSFVPPAYADFANRYLRSLVDYPTDYTSADDVASAVYAAVTGDDDKLRYPAGADSVMLAELRASLPEAAFMGRMRSSFIERGA
jgi:NAD(P)-dependent dehydrogenase (short-subunit alcohol dehydrogenase family)